MACWAVDGSFSHVREFSVFSKALLEKNYQMLLKYLSNVNILFI
jgi:hypothetical protein